MSSMALRFVGQQKQLGKHQDPNKTTKTKMRAYYFDNLPDDQRLPHINSERGDVSLEELAKCGVQYWHVPVDSDSNWEQVSGQYERFYLSLI
jgi:hypothetical protein